MKTIILISGKMGSGKTTLADALAVRLGQNRRANVVRTRFAKALYEMHDATLAVARKYGIPVEEKEKDLLQLMGTEWGRTRFGANVWVECVRNEIDAIYWPEDIENYVIIDDARFDSEIDGFPEAFTIRLECDRETRKERCEKWRENENHPSEVGLDHRIEDFKMLFNSGLMSTDRIVDNIVSTLCAD